MVFQTEGSQLTSWMIFCSSLFSLSSCLDFSSSLLLVDEPVFMVSWASDCHSPRVIRRRIYETCTCSFYYKKVRFWAASVIQGLLAEWEQSRAARPVLPESYIHLSNVGVIFWYPRSFWQHNVWQKTLPGDRGQQTCWRLWADIDADTAGQGQFTGHCGTCHTSPGDSPDERQFIIPDAYTAAVICREETVWGGQSSALPWGQTGPQGWCRPRRRWPRRRRQRRRPAERTGSWSLELWSYTAPGETVERLQRGWKSKMLILSV